MKSGALSSSTKPCRQIGEQPLLPCCSRLQQQRLSKSPTTYIIMARIEAAKRHLITTSSLLLWKLPAQTQTLGIEYCLKYSPTGNRVKILCKPNLKMRKIMMTTAMKRMLSTMMLPSAEPQKNYFCACAIRCQAKLSTYPKQDVAPVSEKTFFHSN